MMERHTREDIIVLLEGLSQWLIICPPYFKNDKALGNLAGTKINARKSKFAFHSWVNQTHQNIVS
jgi:hypothetical protein